MKNLLYILICISIIHTSNSVINPPNEPSKATTSGLLENAGYSCRTQQSLRLDRRLHGKPEVGEPPLDITVLDENDKPTSFYTPNKIYKIKLIAFVYFRGLLLQSRLCTPSGQMIGSLRGGRFIKNEKWIDYGIDYQNCYNFHSNDSITHINDDKKYEMEIMWTSDRHLGSVQFLLTIAKENNEYWERWASPTAFLEYSKESHEDLKSNETETFRNNETTIIPSITIEFDNNLASITNLNSTATESDNDLINGNDTFIIESASNSETIFKENLENDGAILDILDSSSTFKETFETPSDGLPFDSSLFDEVNTFSTISSDIFETTPSSTFPPEPVHTPRAPKATKNVPIATEDQIINEVTERVFKKYVPDKQTGLHTDDVHFLNSHAHLLRDFIAQSDAEELCHQSNPCENDGECTVVDRKIKCECVTGYVGDRCNVSDACINHGCLEGSYCVNDMKGSYTCKCKKGFVGSYCQYQCSKDQCLNGGECIMRGSAEIACKCLPGYSGNNCEREINECNYNHCMNGAGCTDLVNDYKCHCSEGWMGKNCDRPCQDVYGSCRIWKREGQCELMRGTTDYFDVNCAASCEQCIYNNSTLTTDTPLPPVLLPLAWLLGEWQTHQRGFRNKTIDFPQDMEDTNGYNETIIFSVAKGLMFGTPSINYTSIAVADNNPENVHETNGFITVRQYAPKEEKDIIRAALMTVSNVGITLIEEGDVMTTRTTMGHHLNLAPTYQLAPMESKKKIAPKQFRSFVRKGNRLMQLMTRQTDDGHITKFSKTYVRIKEFQYM